MSRLMEESYYGFTLKELVDKLGCLVTVQLSEGDSQGKQKKGYLYTVDPLRGHIVLIDNAHAQVIMRHAVQSLQVHDEDRIEFSHLDAVLDSSSNVDATWIQERKDAFIQLLEKHRIPFKYEDPVIHVLGRARVEPPYVATSVVSDQAMIRSRVRDLLVMQLPLFRKSTGSNH